MKNSKIRNEVIQAHTRTWVDKKGVTHQKQIPEQVVIVKDITNQTHQKSIISR